jgi:pimeloyl-ACP methyl ester carboxylesterase
MLRVRLLHGLGADRRAFQRFERLLPQEWQIHSLDLLGHGDAPHPEHGYSLDDHAAWVESQVIDAAPVVLIGHSYGAATSVAVAARRPELVQALVLLDPIVRLDVNETGTKTAQMIEARRSGDLPATVARLFPESSAALQAWTVDTWQHMSLGVTDELDPDWTRFADRVTCPVAIVHGELELGGGGDLGADWFDEPVVTEIHGAGHYLHATHARETAAAIVQSLGSLSVA